MRQVITIESLEVIDAIDRKGSFASAAAELYRVPSAITYTVQKLEQDLGITLFKRDGRRSLLTPAGLEILNEGRRILEATTALAESAKRVDSGWEPRLNIAVETFFPVSSVYPVLNDFYQVYADIEFNIFEEVLAGCWDSLIEGSVDLVIGAPDLPPSNKGITAQPLIEVESIMVAAATHPATQLDTPIAFEQLQQFRSVIARDSAKNLAHLNVGLPISQTIIRVPTMSDKIEAHCHGVGVGNVPKYRVKHLLESGELVELKMDYKPRKTQFYIGWRSSNKGKVLHWVVEEIIERWAELIQHRVIKR
jgi:DNA-binding transcriptional LysR family regulator